MISPSKSIIICIISDDNLAKIDVATAEEAIKADLVANAAQKTASLARHTAERE